MRTPLLVPYSAVISAAISAAAISAAFGVPTAAADNPKQPAAKQPAAKQPAGAVTTQACLGPLATFLTCPAGAALSGTECRQREPRRGAAPGEHWSGSQRQGPAVFLRGALGAAPTAGAKISFATQYKNHKKNGRVFRFDKEGRLESWNNVIDDEWYGLAVTCTPEGTVKSLANHAGNKVVGISRSWRTSDGTLSYALDHDASGKVTAHLEATPELARRPDELCRPARCDVAAAPDLSAMPRGVAVPAAK
jgi:hypothetical protein